MHSTVYTDQTSTRLSQELWRCSFLIIWHTPQNIRRDCLKQLLQQTNLWELSVRWSMIQSLGISKLCYITSSCYEWFSLLEKLFVSTLSVLVTDTVNFDTCAQLAISRITVRASFLSYGIISSVHEQNYYSCVRNMTLNPSNTRWSPTAKPWQTNHSLHGLECFWLLSYPQEFAIVVEPWPHTLPALWSAKWHELAHVHM